MLVQAELQQKSDSPSYSLAQSCLHLLRYFPGTLLAAHNILKEKPEKIVRMVKMMSCRDKMQSVLESCVLPPEDVLGPPTIYMAQEQELELIKPTTGEKSNKSRFFLNWQKSHFAF
ncbi:hypothetical protein M9H77_01337 [Catharanthus roseus]|uniref:Uncharacterized protein n=1 Tax=Catharanthus roseus TaxID=4058 RepID=A0ACC0C5F2_CATRO|nr:hypothetical protein M9H77_01337 [Catharanthus roseus]